MSEDRSNALRALKEGIKSGDLGKTPNSIISTCEQIAEIDLLSSREQILSILVDLQISKKKWKILCRIGRDSRLLKYSADLPASITTLYALSLLTNDELNDGMVTGELNRSVSSREVYAYAKRFRLRSRAFSDTADIMPCYLALSPSAKGLDSSKIEELMKDANRILSKNGLMILLAVASTSKFAQEQHDLIRKEQVQSSIETSIEHQMYLASDQFSRYFSLEEIDEIMEGSMNQFVSALLSVSKSRIQMMQTYGVAYCYKIALEYHRSNSRVQRYNYKRRLIHVQQKYKFLSATVDTIFDEFIERPKKT